MTASHPDSEEELFHACLDLAETERASYLARAGVGPDLRLRVERLLAASARADESTLQPLADLPLAAAPDRIGDYRLLGVLGEGGMGVVYEAEQTHPVRRRVALKIVKLGMDTQQIVARFMAESRALAAMDHPYVAKVFDVGHTVSGMPYFVMEMVPGEPLLQYCERNALSMQERLALFVKICHAVQHAHQKSVIHRDLKPSNLLVRVEDEGPMPKVIDFGIAKALGTDEIEAVDGMTRVGQTLGTPAYMSPEQAGRGAIDVDTRADIYSLGVILYELLTGALPADPSSIGETEFLAMLARGALNPSRASVRASAAGRSVPADLDWIVMKALQVERDRRYETALSLADDLERFLRHEPVSARPPSLAYRAGKFVRRYRLQAGAAAVALVALAAGGIAATVGLVRANHAEAIASREAATARQVSAFLTELFGAADPNARSSTTLRELLDRGAARVAADLAGQPRVQADLFSTLGHVYSALGLHRQGLELSERSLALDAAAGEETLRTAETLMTVARSAQTLGVFDRAQAAVERAIAIRRLLLGENDLATAAAFNALGGVLGQLEHYDEAIAAHTRALATQERVRGPADIAVTNSLRGLATLYARKGDPGKALDYDQRVLAIYRTTYGELHPLTAGGYEAVAFDLLDLDRLDEARSTAERAVDNRLKTVGPNHPDTAFAYTALGQILAKQGALDAALAPMREGLRIRESTLGADNPRTADTLTSLGLLMMRRHEITEARQMLERALGIYRQAYGPNHSKTLRAEKNVALVGAQTGQDPNVPRRNIVSNSAPTTRATTNRAKAPANSPNPTRR